MRLEIHRRLLLDSRSSGGFSHFFTHLFPFFALVTVSLCCFCEILQKKRRMKDTILSISGRPGLFRLVAQGRGNLIVETIDESKRRFPAGSRDRVTSLNDVSMYTDDDDVALMQVFQNISDKHEGKPVDLKLNSATNKELSDFMAEALPNYDRDRVHFSDIRKLIQWYNLLARDGYTEFVEQEEKATEESDTAE